jgi:hypothetical protein
MILIGSKAIKFHVPSWRDPADTDLVGTYDEIEKYQKIKKPKVCYPFAAGASVFMKASDGQITECEIAWQGSRAEKLIKFVEEDSGTQECWGMKIPSLDVLYMLKMSHRFLKDSPHFKKTMDDIFVLRELGAKILPQHQEFYEQRMRDTYVNKLPKLNQSKEDFFSGDGIVYEWLHDSLHEAVKLGERPAYLEYSGGAVWSDMKVFETLPEYIKLRGVYEEAATLAAERSQLAFNPAPDPRWSFEFALGKVCSSITGGKFREYAWENYYKVMDLYEREGQDYMDKVYAGIKSGLVKKTEETNAQH